MKNDTKQKIIRLASASSGARPHELIETLQISAVAVHKHLQKLTEQGLLEKKGKPPHVIYLSKITTSHDESINLPNEIRELLNNNFCYFSPSGVRFDGALGFIEFLKKTQQDEKPLERALEYQKIIIEAEKFKDRSGLIDGTDKVKTTFNECYLKKVYYSDFYSLPKYGKTKLGQYLLHGKSGQNQKMIKAITDMTKADINKIIKKHQIEAIVFAPHSIPRKFPFLKEYRRLLKIELPELLLKKVFSGDVPIAQKSLSKLSERIYNARETIFVKDIGIHYKRILIIDDALGSGATMNEIAHKLSIPDRLLYGYVVVGSYKGFEVLKEV
jgi:predicted amidophosphoribosyltransferase